MLDCARRIKSLSDHYKKETLPFTADQRASVDGTEIHCVVLVGDSEDAGEDIICQRSRSEAGREVSGKAGENAGDCADLCIDCN
jgi:hypothetical protein